MLGEGRSSNLDESREQPNPNENAHDEWIPQMLRKSLALLLAFTCFAFSALLETLDVWMKKNQGIATDQATIVFVSRYLPTVCAVTFGFIWKCLVGDVKKIVPWANTSGKWAHASDSILLNYIDDIEIVSAAKAAKRKHWTMLLALSVGLLSGLATTTANTLTYIDVNATVSKETTIQKTSRFDFDGTLSNPNGTLTRSFDLESSSPYVEALTGHIIPGHFGPWTKDEHVFDSIANNESKFSAIAANTTVKANVSSITVDMGCQQLRYSAKTNPDVDRADLFANPQDFSCAGCDSIRSPVTAVYHKANGWLNFTSCSKRPNDSRLLATVAYKESYSTVAPVGLVCSPKFTVQEAQIEANATSGAIIEYSLDSSTRRELDIRVPLEVLWIYLNYPIDSRLQPEIRSWKSLNTSNTQDLVESYQDFPPLDPFFTALAGGGYESAIKAYTSNPSLFQSDVEGFATKILQGVISYFTRIHDTQLVDGSISTPGPRMSILRVSLRALQAILIFAGVTSALLATSLRPRTFLRDDPGSIASTATIFKTSDTRDENRFGRQAVTCDKTFQNALAHIRCKLRLGSERTSPVIEFDDLGATYLCSAQNAPAHIIDYRNHAGWRPFAFRMASKTGLIAAFCLAISGLAVLQKLSDAHDGLCKDSSILAPVLSYSSTGILVLLSYACSGVDGAIRSVASYRSLRRTSRKQALQFNIRDIPILWNTSKGTKTKIGFAVVASSLAMLSRSTLQVFTHLNPF